MDRNYNLVHRQPAVRVATREGGVDRNKICWQLSASPAHVATREGGVDRNRYYFDVEAANDSRHPRGWRG